MLDANIRTDYNKLRHLIHIDKTFGENASVAQEIIEKGSTTELKSIALVFQGWKLVRVEEV